MSAFIQYSGIDDLNITTASHTWGRHGRPSTRTWMQSSQGQTWMNWSSQVARIWPLVGDTCAGPITRSQEWTRRNFIPRWLSWVVIQRIVQLQNASKGKINVYFQDMHKLNSIYSLTAQKKKTTWKKKLKKMMRMTLWRLMMIWIQCLWSPLRPGKRFFVLFQGWRKLSDIFSCSPEIPRSLTKEAHTDDVDDNMDVLDDLEEDLTSPINSMETSQANPTTLADGLVLKSLKVTAGKADIAKYSSYKLAGATGYDILTRRVNLKDDCNYR